MTSRERQYYGLSEIVNMLTTESDRAINRLDFEVAQSILDAIEKLLSATGALIDEIKKEKQK